MHPRKRRGRQAFLAYVCAAWFAAFMAVPLLAAFEPASAGPGRADAFRAADANGDGRLDRLEFRRALALRDGRR